MTIIVLTVSLFQTNRRTESEAGRPGEACRTALSRETTVAASVGGADQHGGAGEAWAVLPEALASCVCEP